jgi:GT2 family glycosyltransferase
LLRRAAGGPGTASRAPIPPGQPLPLSSAISIGMAAHGNARATQRALDALFAAASGDFELILVDDESPDDTLAVFREARRWHPNTRIFAFPKNREYCESVNAFLSHARGDYLFFISNDIYASPAYLRTLLDSAIANPDCGILRGCSNFVDRGSPLHIVPMEGTGTREAYFAFTEALAERHRDAPLVDETFLVGDAFLVNRRAIERIGTFDTRFKGYLGDVDFGLRAQIAGFRVVLQRRAFAFHHTHSNIFYLPEEEQRQRWQRRRDYLSLASDVFVVKYELTPEECSWERVPWARLSRQPFDPARHYVAPRDYSEFLLPG